MIRFLTDGKKSRRHLCDEGTWRAVAKKAVHRGEVVILGAVGYSIEDMESVDGKHFQVRAAFNLYGCNGQTRHAIRCFPWEDKAIDGERATRSDGALPMVLPRRA